MNSVKLPWPIIIRDYIRSTDFHDGMRKAFLFISIGLIVGFASDNVSYGILAFYGAFVVRLAYTVRSPLKSSYFIFFTALSMIALLAFIILVVRISPEFYLPIFILFAFVTPMLAVYGESGASFSSALLICFIFGNGILEAETLGGQLAVFFSIGIGSLYYALSIAALDYFFPVYSDEWAFGKFIEQAGRYLSAKIAIMNSEKKESFEKLMKAESELFKRQETARVLVYKNKNSRKKHHSNKITYEAFADCSRLIVNLEALKLTQPEKNTVLLKLLARKLKLISYAVQHGTDIPRVLNLSIFENSENIILIAWRINKIIAILKGEPHKVTAFSLWNHKLFKPDLSWRLKVLAENFKWSSEIFRNSIRIGISLAVVAVLNKYFHLGYAEWAFLAVIICLKPQYSGTVQKSWQRISGNAFGVMIGIVLLFFLQGNLVPVLIVGVISLFVSMLVYNISYQYYAVFYGNARMIILSLGGVYSPVMGYYRISDTLIGIVLALLISRLIPDVQQQKFPSRLAGALNASAAYMSELLNFMTSKEDKMAYRRTYSNMHKQYASLLSLWENLNAGHSKQREFIILRHSFIDSVRVINEHLAILAEKSIYDPAPIKESDVENCRMIIKRMKDIAEPCSKAEEKFELENLKDCSLGELWTVLNNQLDTFATRESFRL